MLARLGPQRDALPLDPVGQLVFAIISSRAGDEVCFGSSNASGAAAGPGMHSVASRLRARIDEIFMRLVPDDWDADDHYESHRLMKCHGQRTCTHAAPACSRCSLQALCRHASADLRKAAPSSPKKTPATSKR
jgi:hypothetical protein